MTPNRPSNIGIDISSQLLGTDCPIESVSSHVWRIAYRHLTKHMQVALVDQVFDELRIHIRETVVPNGRCIRRLLIIDAADYRMIHASYVGAPLHESVLQGFTSMLRTELIDNRTQHLGDDLDNRLWRERKSFDVLMDWLRLSLQLSHEKVHPRLGNE
jgi:hypothetical protein